LEPRFFFSSFYKSSGEISRLIFSAALQRRLSKDSAGGRFKSQRNSPRSSEIRYTFHVLPGLAHSFGAAAYLGFMPYFEKATRFMFFFWAFIL